MNPVTRYQQALEIIVTLDNPTIKDHAEFVEQMKQCADETDSAQDEEIYLLTAESHERIIMEMMK